MPEEKEEFLEITGAEFPDLPINLMAHFYRGEVQRIIAWRQRIDSTTGWTVAVATATLSIAFSGPDRPGEILLLGMALLLAILGIEARRYRYYDLWRARVRMIEAGWLAPALDPRHAPLGNRWRELLNQDLIAPAFKMPRSEAIGRRFMRGHMYFLAIMILGWGMKLAIHPTPLTSIAEFFRRASLGGIPGEAVAGLVVGHFLCLLALGLWIRGHRKASGRARQPDKSTLHEWGI